MNTTRRRGPGSPTALRAANRDRVLEAVADDGPLSQAAIARATGLAPSTISLLVGELEADGDVEIAESGGAGRPRRMVSLPKATGVVVGIDHGRFHLTVAVADTGPELLAEQRVITDGGLGVAETVERIGRTVDEVLAETGRTRADVRRACLALPAPIESRTGRVGAAAVLPGWAGIDPAQVCTDALGVQVSAHNDTNLGAFGEARWGAGRGARSFAYVWASEGLGSGLVINGSAYAGIGGVAGEIGHTLERSERGDLCRCGNRGCLETVVSSRAVVRLLEPQVGPLSGFDEVIEMARGGNVLCRRVLADTGRHLGIAVANLVNLLDPQRVILGGDLSRAQDLILDPMAEVVRQYAIPSAAAGVEIAPAELGNRAEVLGAVAKAAEEVRQESNAGQ